MASTKVRGITIELGADTTGLSKALKDVNSEIRNTQKDLKDVERLLKLDPGNTELLAQKQKLLSDRVEETKTKLDALKKAQESIDMSTEDGQRQYDALSREIIACENELKEAEAAAKSFNATAEKISVSAGKMADKFGSMAQKTRGLSLAATGAITGLAGLAVKAASDADELTTLAKQTGLTTDEIQKMKYAAEGVDVDTDTIIGGMKKMKKSLEKNKDTFKKMGVEVKTWNGEYRNTSDIFFDTVQALSKIPNETERDIVAMELFGKSADELAGIIDDGGAALRALGKEAENLGVIIPEEELEKASEINDNIEKLKAQGSATLMELGGQIAEMILPYLPQIQEWIESILQKIREIDPETIKIVGAIAAITAVLSPVLSVLSGIASVVSAIAKIAPGVASAVSSAISGISSFLTADIGATLAAGGTSAGIMFASALVASITSFLAGAELGKKLGAYLFPDDKELYESYSGIEGTFNMIKDLGIALKDFFVMAWEDGLKRYKIILQLAEAAFEGLMRGLASRWLTGWNIMKESFLSVAYSMLSVFKGILNEIISGVNNVSNGLRVISGGAINFGTIKPMAEGGVLTSGSAIVGEAGPEFVQVSSGEAMVQPLTGHSDLAGLLETYLPYLAAGTQLVMDSGALVGSIAPDMNAALGTIAIRGGRR
jgi:phage-related minor tail protein